LIKTPADRIFRRNRWFQYLYQSSDWYCGAPPRARSEGPDGSDSATGTTTNVADASPICAILST
jgi:hypothetical protein